MRKEEPPEWAKEIGRPSMGPQHESCGKYRRRVLHVWVQVPSMGPQHESCGKWFKRKVEDEAEDPSMGPQHESCGKSVRIEAWKPSGRLQWGRNMRVAER